MVKPIITSGKGDGIYTHYLQMSPERLATTNKSTIVQNCDIEARPTLSGSIFQVVNDMPFPVVLKILSEYQSVDYIGAKPSVDLRFFLYPGATSMGWIVYNCDFNLNTVVETDGRKYEREWTEITVKEREGGGNEAEGIYSVAVSTLIKKEQPAIEKPIKCCSVS